MTIPAIENLAPVAADHDAFLFDLWGVVHNGVQAFPGAVRTLEGLAAAGRPVILLSNAPRLGTDVDQRLQEMGIDRGLYRRVVASGDLVRHGMNLHDAPFGRRFLFWGKPADRSVLAGLDFTEVTDPTGADFVLCAGLDDVTRETVADYQPRLQAARDAGLVLVCANPDYVVQHGDTLEPCAGALALAYEDLGGTAHWYGKPYANAYDYCRSVLEDVDFSRCLMIGDTIRTDIQGAHDAGIAAVLVASGVHSSDFLVDGAVDTSAVAAACAAAGVAPRAVMPRLDW
ncbi:MAG: TIGR01459 family HAD-type hydrolase [Minwuia sp.]|nr:TIGR01459 family HAD-type hydrolase [Minwuia sp.]